MRMPNDDYNKIIIMPIWQIMKVLVMMTRMLGLGIGDHGDFNANNDGDDEDDDDDDSKAESWGTRVQRRAGAAVGLRQRRQPHLCGSF